MADACNTTNIHPVISVSLVETNKQRGRHFHIARRYHAITFVVLGDQIYINKINTLARKSTLPYTNFLL